MKNNLCSDYEELLN